MSNLFNMPRAEAQDSSGGVLAGAKLLFEESGTSTKLDTFSDDALATANANPVVADSAARWSAIFLKDAKYKVTLSDSADVQIWSADPVDGGLDNLADDTIRSTLSTTGSTNAYALTVNRVITAYANGDMFVCKANFQNTGSATLNVTGGQSGASALGAKTIKKLHDVNLASADIENGQWMVLMYDGTFMQLLSGVVTTGYTDPITTRGDMIRGDSSGNVERLALGTSNQVVQSDGTDLLWGAVPTATDTVVGGLETATQAEQETGTATDKIVTPGRQHFHDSACKTWADFDAAGSLGASRNVSSITDVGTGDWTVNFTISFSGTGYSAVGSVRGQSDTDANGTVFGPGAKATGTCKAHAKNTANALVDSNDINVAFFGDL